MVSHCSRSTSAEPPLRSLTFPLETHSDTQRLSTIALPTRSHILRLLGSVSATTQPLRLPVLCWVPSNQAHPTLGCPPFSHVCPFSLSSTQLAYLIVCVSEATPPQTDHHRSAHVPLGHLDTLSPFSGMTVFMDLLVELCVIAYALRWGSCQPCSVLCCTS